MNRRLSLLYKMKTMSLIIALVWGVGTVAQARYPEVNQMNTVQGLARQLSLDSRMLAEAASAAPGAQAGALSNQGVQSFAALSQAAEHFQRQVSDNFQNPDHTEADYLTLRDAYRKARLYFDAVPGGAAVQDAIRRTRDAMFALIGYYAEEHGPEGYDPAIVSQTALQLMLLADWLATRAVYEHGTGRVDVAAVQSINRIAEATHRFNSLVVRYKADPIRIDEEYDRLVQRLLDARSYLAGFTMDFQDEYGSLWHQAQSINYLSPGAAVGGPPYAAHPFVH